MAQWGIVIEAPFQKSPSTVSKAVAGSAPSEASRKKQRSSPRRRIFREGVSGSGNRPIPVQDVSELARKRLKRRQSVAYIQLLHLVEDRIGFHRSGIRNNVRIDS